MKKLSLIVYCCIALIALSGCSKKVYTHQQVLQSFHTKNDVAKRFGTPSDKSTLGNLEVWTYDMDTPSPANKTPKPGTALNKTPDSLKATPAITYTHYIKFIFDTAGNVQGYKSSGVNLSTTKRTALEKV